MPGLPQRLLRTFSRKQGKSGGASPPPTPPSATASSIQDKSWQAGDQVECINEKGWMTFTPAGLVPVRGIALGQILIVSDVRISLHPLHGEVIFLIFRGTHGMFEAACFRKLQPVADKAEAADSTFLQDLRERLKPVTRPVPERENA